MRHQHSTIEIKDMILDNFETENINIDHKNNSLDVTFEWDGISDDPESLKIVIVACDEFKDKQGIHLLESVTLEHDLADNIFVALRDGFKTIYIYRAS